MSIVQLFTALQQIHNTAAEVMGHLAFLGHTLDPEQFSFIFKHSVRPLIQLFVPVGLSDLTYLQFEHPALTEEEQFEEKAINSMLPMPHHPKLMDLPPKIPHIVWWPQYTMCSDVISLRTIKPKAQLQTHFRLKERSSIRWLLERHMTLERNLVKQKRWRRNKRR